MVYEIRQEKFSVGLKKRKALLVWLSKRVQEILKIVIHCTVSHGFPRYLVRDKLIILTLRTLTLLSVLLNSFLMRQLHTSVHQSYTFIHVQSFSRSTQILHISLVETNICKKIVLTCNIVNGLNPGVSKDLVVWSSTKSSSEKICCWWLTFQQPVRKLSSESSEE